MQSQKGFKMSDTVNKVLGNFIRFLLASLLLLVFIKYKTEISVYLD